ncbi:uncharacterized protein LOC113277516 [Papaver somniferum]|uniref:uncharacterized protein LOC113277516 n=1 Tax=Papaver somniferum TaxID=3469 RepID=UPI000E6F671A|nr:uncharacterized protein LOC113277516 [Papaver somniferum]
MEETLQAISRAIHMEVNRRVNNGEEPQEEDSEDDEPLENIDNGGATSSTHDYNDHFPIRKEEVESRNTTIIDGKTYVVYESDDDYDFFVNNTPNSEIVNTLNEKSTCDEAHKDYENLLMEDSDFFSDEEESDEEWLVKSLNENCDTCDVGESMDFFRSTEDPVMREIMRGLSNPLYESLSNDDPPKLEVVSHRVGNPSFRKIPHLGMELCASKVLSEFLASKYPPYAFESNTMQVCREERDEVPSTYILYTLPSVERTKCEGDSRGMIVSIFPLFANICVKLLLYMQIVLWVDPQIFKLLIYGESILNITRMRQSGEQFQFLFPCLFQVFLLFFLQWFETLRTMFDLSVGVVYNKKEKS